MNWTHVRHTLNAIWHGAGAYGVSAFLIHFESMEENLFGHEAWWGIAAAGFSFVLAKVKTQEGKP